VCDSPPLTAGIDPFVLGTATGNLVVVLRTGVSNREVIETKLESWTHARPVCSCSLERRA